MTTTLSPGTTPAPRAAGRRTSGLALAAIERRLDRLASGHLVLDLEDRRRTFGRPGEGTQAHVRVHDRRLFRRIALGGVLAVGEAYVDGDWDSDDLVAVVRLFVENRSVLGGLDGGLSRLRNAAQRLRCAWPGQGRRRAARDIRAHYDLGNDLFAAFLDPTMTYSSGIYGPDLDPRDPDALEAAQRAKLERICSKLALEPGQRVLEIGCGWGSFALHAAQHHGVHVVGTTISPAQREEARRRVAAAGVADRVTILGEDYRDLTGRFDRVVSVEMVEAVGARHLPLYLQVVADRLRPNGLALIQAITIGDHLYEAALKRVDFIKRHVFPGSFIPSVAALTAAAAPTGLRLLHLEDIGPSYAATLAAWRARFEAAWPNLAARGATDRFRRLWRYYLAYCEGGFRAGVLGDVQMVLAPSHTGAPSWLAQPEPCL